MNSNNTLSSWIDPLTREQMGDLLVNPVSQRNAELTPDEWWTKLKQTTEAIDTAPPSPPMLGPPTATPITQAQLEPQGIPSPITKRPEALPRTAISTIRQKLDSLAPKPSTHQQSTPPTQAEPQAEEPTVIAQGAQPEIETPSARPPLTPTLAKLQLPKPQAKATTTAPTPSPQPTKTVPEPANRPTKTASQIQRALDRYDDWAKEYLSFSNICLLDEFGDIVAGHSFDSTFTAAASTLGNAFLNATQFRQGNESPDDEVHQFPHHAAHTPWEEQQMAVIPVRTPGGLIIVAGLADEAIDRRRACMAAETLLRVTGYPKD